MTRPTPSARLEDARFLTGRGRYTADSSRSGQAYGRVVRADHAHAEIRAIDTEAAAAMDGVLGIWTGADLAGEGLGTLPCAVEAATDGPIIAPPRHALARARVRHVGEPVAFIVAENPAAAVAAADLVEIDYDPLPAVIGAAAALAADAPQIWTEAPGNTAFHFRKGDRAATERALEGAAHVVELALVNQRVAAAPMEPRAGVGAHHPGADPAGGRFTLELAGQGLHAIRQQLAGSVFGLPDDRVDLFAHDVGGGFGLKNFLFPEWVLLTWAARRLGRPVKWVADNSEDLAAAVHGRAIDSVARLGLGPDGAFLGLSVDMVLDLGAYASGGGPGAATNAASTAMGGIYAIPAIFMHSCGVFTNTAPVDAYRGAGKPEANFVIERLIDAACRRHGFDPVALRLRNVVNDFPYRKALGAVLDCGHYRQNILTAVERADRAGFETRRQQSRRAGRLRGLGVACFLESARGAPQEEVAVRIAADGTVELVTGTESAGQGHETSFTMLAADRLGLPPARIRYIQADTRQTRTGFGHGGARTTHMGAGTLALAIDALLDKGRRVAAQLLQVAPDRLRYADGAFSLAEGGGVLRLEEVAAAARGPEFAAELGGDGLDSTVFRRDAPYTFPGGCHLAELEVDPETGAVELLRYTAVDDYGRLLEPALAAGQVHGGLAQGIGQALVERVVYDPDSGQLLSGSLMDYALPRAADLPMFDILLDGAPTGANVLGAKGAGQAGCISAPPAIVNAVIDALAPLGIDHLQMPLTSESIWRAIRAAR